MQSLVWLFRWFRNRNAAAKETSQNRACGSTKKSSFGKRSGIPGISENIRVRSILGRFLEHSRVYYFYAGGKERTYLSSADWMPRNFFRRVEVCLPVEGKKLKRRVIEESLLLYLQDDLDAWELGPNGQYARLRPSKNPCSAQKTLLELWQDDGSSAP